MVSADYYSQRQGGGRLGARYLSRKAKETLGMALVPLTDSDDERMLPSPAACGRLLLFLGRA